MDDANSSEAAVAGTNAVQQNALVLVFYQFSQIDKAPERLATKLSDELNHIIDAQGHLTVMASATAVDDFQDRSEPAGTIKIVYAEGKRDQALQTQSSLTKMLKAEGASSSS